MKTIVTPRVIAAGLSPNDELADYGRWDKASLNGAQPHRPEMLQYEYARAALKHSLSFEQQLGANRFKFGMIGSTDSHAGCSMPAINGRPEL